MVGFGKFKLIEHIECNPSYGLPFPARSNPFTSHSSSRLSGGTNWLNGIHDLSTEVCDGFADIISIQQTVTLGVDHLTLIVSHIIVFKQVLADIEVATFQLRWAFSMSPYDALSHGRRLISVMCFYRFVT